MFSSVAAGAGEEPAEGTGESPEENGLPEILRGSDPMETVERLSESDPFNLAERARHRARELGLILDPERLEARAMARVAFAALAYRGELAFEEWVTACVDQTLQELLSEQAEEERQQVPIAQSLDGEFYKRFASIVQIPAQHGRLACLVMNRMPIEDRKTFFGIVIEGKSVNRWVAEGNGPPERVVECLQRIGRTVLAALNGRKGEGGASHG